MTSECPHNCGSDMYGPLHFGVRYPTGDVTCHYNDMDRAIRETAELIRKGIPAEVVDRVVGPWRRSISHAEALTYPPTREVTCENCTDEYVQVLSSMWEQNCTSCGHPAPEFTR